MTETRSIGLCPEGRETPDKKILCITREACRFMIFEGRRALCGREAAALAVAEAAEESGRGK
ncbi:MAG: hypothetical protein M0Q92_15735 [Methanoregula sp.]|jgi:hypothetical protein|nr:hypothetical protein [Methanoregula sp.]